MEAREGGQVRVTGPSTSEGGPELPSPLHLLGDVLTTKVTTLSSFGLGLQSDAVSVLQTRNRLQQPLLVLNMAQTLEVGSF